MSLPEPCGQIGNETRSWKEEMDEKIQNKFIQKKIEKDLKEQQKKEKEALNNAFVKAILTVGQKRKELEDAKEHLLNLQESPPKRKRSNSLTENCSVAMYDPRTDQKLTIFQ